MYGRARRPLVSVQALYPEHDQKKSRKYRCVINISDAAKSRILPVTTRPHMDTNPDHVGHGSMVLQLLASNLSAASFQCTPAWVTQRVTLLHIRGLRAFMPALSLSLAH